MNRKPRHAMIDIETMGTDPECAIVSIGAVIFDPRYDIIITNSTFYWELAWRKQGRRIDHETEVWWGEQSVEARVALNGIEQLSTCLRALGGWLPPDVKVWGNGPVFDMGFLEHAYLQCEQPIPWKFWNVRCCRTIKDMYESKRGGFSHVNTGVAHNALDDAIAQAKMVNRMWYKLLGNAPTELALMRRVIQQINNPGYVPLNERRIRKASDV